MGRTWKNIDAQTSDEIKICLLNQGGSEVGVKADAEAWRIKFSDSTFTFYKSGTLFSTPSRSDDPAVFKAWKHVDSLVGSGYEAPTKDFLIGLDETGKGELVGHTVLTGVIFPQDLFDEIDLLLGPADTKKRHTFEYWDDIFKKLDRLRGLGLDFITEKIPPWHVDRYNINKIVDVTYQRILSMFLRRAKISQCRVVLDDYGVGPTLSRFLNFLQKQGAEVVVTSKSDEKYLEAKTASVISKRDREAVTRSINRNPDYQINGLSIGSGNAGDKQTLEWLNKWHATGKRWPWFIKRSFSTVRRIEGKAGRAHKIIPPIREELLSKEFIEEFNKGKLSIQSLSVICPHCGNALKSAAFAVFEREGRKISELKCADPDCGKIIVDAGTTLRFYSGYAVPDSNVIRRNLLSNDLKASKFFENFNIILDPVVRKECDGTPRARKEFEDLWKFNAMGRIKLEAPGRVEDVPDHLSSTERDERVIQACLDYNAILVTGDKSMIAFAGGKDVFTIFI